MTTQQRAPKSSSTLALVCLLVALTIAISTVIAGTLIYGQVRARRVDRQVHGYHLAVRLDISRIEFELNLMKQVVLHGLLGHGGGDAAGNDDRENIRSALIIDKHMQSVATVQSRFERREFDAATQRLAAAVEKLELLAGTSAMAPSKVDSLVDALDLVRTRCVQLDRLHAIAVHDSQAVAESSSARARFFALLSFLVVGGCGCILLTLGLTSRSIKRQEEAESRLAHRALEAESLYQAVKMTNETRSLEAALQECVDIVCKMAGWPVGHAYLPSESDADRLEPSDIWRLSDEQRFAKFREVTEQTSFASGEGLPGRTWESGKPAWFSGVEADRRFLNGCCGALAAKGAFGLPIKIGGRTAAILEFFTERELEADEPLLLMVRSIGEQVSRVIERKAAEESLRETQARLNHVSRLSTMGEMVAGIAHEINQPLSAIANYALASKNTVEAAGCQFEAPVEDWLRGINDQAVRCGDIIRALRGFVKKEHDDGERAGLNRAVLESVALIQSDARCHSVVIDCQLPETETLLPISRIQLQQVIVNLLRNACDAIADAALPRVSVRVERRAGRVRLTVQDNGRGVDEGQQQRLFDTFFTTKPDGMGMGLAISRSIVEAHDGHLRFDAECGPGATFHIELPAVETGQERLAHVG